MTKQELQEVIKTVYLDYLNNYLTIQKFANDYGISKRFAEELRLEARDLINNPDIPDRTY